MKMRARRNAPPPTPKPRSARQERRMLDRMTRVRHHRHTRAALRARHRIGMLYVLDGHRPVRAASMAKWIRAYEAQRIVHQTTVNGCLVSTIFLGMDHNWSGSSGPVLFETMAFPANGPSNFQRRYRTWGEAEAGHAEAVATLARTTGQGA